MSSVPPRRSARISTRDSSVPSRHDDYETEPPRKLKAAKPSKPPGRCLLNKKRNPKQGDEQEAGSSGGNSAANTLSSAGALDADGSISSCSEPVPVEPTPRKSQVLSGATPVLLTKKVIARPHAISGAMLGALPGLDKSKVTETRPAVLPVRSVSVISPRANTVPVFSKSGSRPLSIVRTPGGAPRSITTPRHPHHTVVYKSPPAVSEDIVSIVPIRFSNHPVKQGSQSVIGWESPAVVDDNAIRNKVASSSVGHEEVKMNESVISPRVVSPPSSVVSGQDEPSSPALRIKSSSTGIAVDSSRIPPVIFSAFNRPDFTSLLSKPAIISSHSPVSESVDAKVGPASVSAEPVVVKKLETVDVTGKSDSPVELKPVVSPPAVVTKYFVQRILRPETPRAPRLSGSPAKPRAASMSDLSADQPAASSSVQAPFVCREPPKPVVEEPKKITMILQKVKKAPPLVAPKPAAPVVVPPRTESALEVISIPMSVEHQKSATKSDEEQSEKAKIPPIKSFQKVPAGTSIHVLRKSDATSKPPLAPVPVVPVQSENNPPENVTQLPPISELKTVQNPSLAGTIPKIVASPEPPRYTVSLTVDNSISLPAPVDEVVDDVSKGNYVRSFDSDSTLTASETEAIEARLKDLKKHKKDGENPSPRRPSAKRQRSDSGASPEIPQRSRSYTDIHFNRLAGRSKGKRDKDETGTTRTKRRSTKEPGEPKALRRMSSKSQKIESPPLVSTDVPVPGIKMEDLERTPPKDLKSITEVAPVSPTKEYSDASTLDMLTLVSSKPTEASDEPKLPYVYVNIDDLSDTDESAADHTDDELAGYQIHRKLSTSFTIPCPLLDHAEDDPRHRTRVRSVSVCSDGPFEPSPVGNQLGSQAPTENTTSFGSIPPVKISRRNRANAREVHKIGTLPLTDLGRWKPQDDMMLIMAVQEYRDLVLVHKHVKFSCHFTHIEIQERWFNLLYNRKISKSACQAMRSCPPDILSRIQRKTPFSEAEEALLMEIPLLPERVDAATFQLLLEANGHVFPPFRTAQDLEKHWQVMSAEGRVENADTLCTVLEDAVVVNGERIPSFAEIESKMKDIDLSNWTHVSGEFAYEMDKIQRQNRERLMDVDKEIEHLRYLLEKAVNYELPIFVRPQFYSAQDRCFVAVLLGQRAKYGMKTGKVSLGRSTPENPVDVDLSLESYAGKISRLQGYIVLERNGHFRIENHGRRPVFVDEQILYYGDSAPLPDESMIQVADVFVQFFVNFSRVGRYLRQKYYGECMSDEENEELDKERKKMPKPPKKANKPKIATEGENATDLIALETALQPSAKPKKSRAKPLKSPLVNGASQVVIKTEPPSPPPPAPKPRRPSNRKPKNPPNAPDPPFSSSVPQGPAVDYPVVSHQSRIPNGFPPHQPQTSLSFPMQNARYPQRPPQLLHPAFSLAPPMLRANHPTHSMSNSFTPPPPPVVSSHSSPPGGLRLPSICDLVPRQMMSGMHSPVGVPSGMSPIPPMYMASPPRRNMHSPTDQQLFQNSAVNPDTPHIMHAPASMGMAMMDGPLGSSTMGMDNGRDVNLTQL